MGPTKTGAYRGTCGACCGTAHTLMNFYVVIQERDAFEQWLAHQAEPVTESETPQATSGDSRSSPARRSEATHPILYRLPRPRHHTA